MCISAVYREKQPGGFFKPDKFSKIGWQAAAGSQPARTHAWLFLNIIPAVPYAHTQRLALLSPRICSFF